MNQGRVEQIGTPGEVYDSPASPFVYQFLGDVNLFHGRMESAGYVRPHELDVAPHASAGPTAVAATVRHIGWIGPVVRLELQREDTGQSLEAEIPRDRYRELDLKVGDRVDLTPRNLRVFDNNLSDTTG
jgi:sulfate transport system ATP-binding protein